MNNIARTVANVFVIAGIFAALTLSSLAYQASQEPQPHLELSVASTHQEGAWLRVEEAHGYTWNETKRSHEGYRLHVASDPIVDGEFWWVKAACGTGNIFSVQTADAKHFVTAISFTTEPCPVFDLLIGFPSTSANVKYHLTLGAFV